MSVLLPSTPDFWRITEYPQAVAARRTFLNDPAWEPSVEWGIFQTLRRYGLGGATEHTTTIAGAWSLKRIIAWELNPNAGNPAEHSEVP